jgi:hypothetical protein
MRSPPVNRIQTTLSDSDHSLRFSPKLVSSQRGWLETSGAAHLRAVQRKLSRLAVASFVRRAKRLA